MTLIATNVLVSGRSLRISVSVSLFASEYIPSAPHKSKV